MDRLTIDEAIAHAKEVADKRIDLCEECRAEHLQLAEWLEELKRYKELELTPEQMIKIDKEYAEQAKELSELKKRLEVLRRKIEEMICKYEK